MNLEAIQPHAWAMYAFGLFFYTLMVIILRWPFTRISLILDKNLNNRWAIFIMHLKYLTALLFMMIIANFINPILPAWLNGDFFTRKGGGSGSLGQLLFFFATFIFAAIERFAIYVFYESKDKNPEETQS
jgi:hypothetical protein